MKILPVKNYSICTYIQKAQSKRVSFSQNKSDIFVKSGDVCSQNRLLEILNGDSKNLSKDFFENLTPEEYQYCVDWANSDEKKFSGLIQYSPKSVLPEDVKDIVKYTDFYYSGLQKITYRAGKDMSQVMLVGIGQSPVAAVKLLELSGVKTGYCPISGLTKFDEPIDKYVNPHTVDKYFSYWSTFGFKIDDLFSDKLIVFTDHRETGRTFIIFKDIIKKIIEIKKDEMNQKGRKKAIIKYFSLSDIYKSAKKENEEKKWGSEFEESVYHTSYLKTLYSPLFKLPLQKIKEIKKRHEMAKISDRYIRFNKLIVLMYDELYNKRTKVPEREFSTLENDRQFRLSFYTPKEDEK